MRFRRTDIPALLAVLMVLLLAGLLVVLVFWPDPVRPDRTDAPQWLKELCMTGACQWHPWEEIVIHHSGTDQGNLDIIDRYHRTKRHWESAGYHFVIGNGTNSTDGEIEVGPRWFNQEEGSHCRGHNDKAIGICLIGNFEKTGQKPSMMQMLSLAQLTAYLTLRLGIPVEQVHGHRDMSGAVTLCPGKNFPMNGFIPLVEALRNDYRPH
ncbi:MAG TPA: peptidoglycan recognition family protein [Planctomycetota bacterium]|nr:peptidoglycan recognition family protein [Planctomycetota bacterium]